MESPKGESGKRGEEECSLSKNASMTYICAEND